MDLKDRILQTACPTLMVPRYSSLPAMDVGDKYRFLLSESGLWIETRPIWSHFRLPLWISPRPLPYGEVSEIKHLTGGPIQKSLIRECAELAEKKAEQGLEWAGWITWSEAGGYEYVPLDILHESRIQVVYSPPVLPDNRRLVLDLHSHPFGMTQFSKVDDNDDIGGTRFSGVIVFDGQAPIINMRLCIQGFHFQDMIAGNYGGLP